MFTSASIIKSIIKHCDSFFKHTQNSLVCSLFQSFYAENHEFFCLITEASIPFVKVPMSCLLHVSSHIVRYHRPMSRWWVPQNTKDNSNKRSQNSFEQSLQQRRAPSRRWKSFCTSLISPKTKATSWRKLSLKTPVNMFPIAKSFGVFFLILFSLCSIILRAKPTKESMLQWWKFLKRTNFFEEFSVECFERVSERERKWKNFSHHIVDWCIKLLAKHSNSFIR